MKKKRELNHDMVELAHWAINEREWAEGCLTVKKDDPYLRGFKEAMRKVSARVMEVIYPEDNL